MEQCSKISGGVASAYRNNIYTMCPKQFFWTNCCYAEFFNDFCRANGNNQNDPLGDHLPVTHQQEKILEKFFEKIKLQTYVFLWYEYQARPST